jgi:hypothetical protein
MAGFIAQEVREIPDLSFCVKGEEYDTSGNPVSLRLDYTSIFTHGIAATKELNGIVQEQQQKINTLEDRIQVLEHYINILMNDPPQQISSVSQPTNRLTQMNYFNSKQSSNQSESTQFTTSYVQHSRITKK